MTRAGFATRFLKPCAVAACLAVVAACGGGGGGGGGDAQLASISITPTNSSIAKGLSQQFTATGTFSDGSKKDLSSIVRWASSDTAVVTIGSSGLASGVSVGSTTIVASSEPVSGSTMLTVTPAVLVSVAVTPDKPTIALGTNQSFAAVGTLSDGITLDLTQTVTWSSSDENVLLLNNEPGRIGIANTRGIGSATVVATTGQIAGQASAAVVRRTPKYLYSANVGWSNISAFRVDPANGSISPIPGSPFATTSGPTSLAVTRDLKFLYSADFGAHQISGFLISADGSLTPTLGTPFAAGNGPVSVVVHPTADFLFVANQGSGEVTTYAIDTVSGALSSRSSAAIGFAPLFGAITPDGLRYYQTVSAMNQIAGFSVSAADGALTRIPDAPVSTASFPRAIAIDPAGKFLYVAISTDVKIYGFSIDALSGVLTAVPGSPTTSGESPVSAVVDMSGRFLFVANRSASGSISAFSINPETGALTAVPGSPFPVADGYLLFVGAEPSGRYIYAASDTGISAFAIDQTTGVLTSIGAPPSPGSSVWSIAVTH